MSKKILLVYPPSQLINRSDDFQQPIKNLLFTPNLIPSDLMSLASVAEKSELEAKIAVYNNEKEFKADLKSFNPDYLLINVNPICTNSDLKVLKIAKKINPKIVTIVKGLPFLTSNTDYLYKYKDLDLIIVGEAEDTLKDILKEIPCKEILGLCYRDGFMARYTGQRPYIEHLEVLPFPARHLIDNNLFRCPFTNNIQAVISISRGCPLNCMFCLSPVSEGDTTRIRNNDNVIAEIRECIRNYKIKHFLFQTNNFGFDRQWAMDFCKKIIKSKLKITWVTNLRADNIDETLAKKMYKAGCRVVNIGVESGSQYILDKLRKNLTLNEIRDSIKILKKSGIKAHTTFILGLPWDDYQTSEMTVNFAIELEGDFVSFYISAPICGSPLYNYAAKQNLLNSENSFEDAYCKPIIKTFSLNKKSILNIQKEAYKRFYIRPWRVFKTIINLKSVNEILNYIKLATILSFQQKEKPTNSKRFHKLPLNK